VELGQLPVVACRGVICNLKNTKVIGLLIFSVIEVT
jgi:hypothetical protein